MAAATHLLDMPELAPRRMRHKSVRRRLAREVRLYSPFAVMGMIALLAVGATATVEWLTPRGGLTGTSAITLVELAYSAPTISISSTSNVSAAPPGILGGAPLSP
jgi:hypothetical protein